MTFTDHRCCRLDDMQRFVTLRILLEQPPKGVDFGLQKGRGSMYETEQTKRSVGVDLRFEIELEVKPDHNSPDSVLRGPYVQGPRERRFIYIDIGACAGQQDTTWSRRMKIPLAGITAEMLRKHRILEARVPGTGKDGGPNCATVEPLDGWKPAA